MRIPSYNGDFEEPWYWSNYGELIYNYSFYLDKYNQLGNKTDLDLSNAAKAQIPTNALNEFTWRRQRNFGVTTSILDMQIEFLNVYKIKLFEQIYITLDDNAAYGFNKNEERQLVKLVQQYKLNGTVNIYPGADEVALTLLSRASVDNSKSSAPKVLVVFRDPSTKEYIPNYEGQPLVSTIESQIKGAGGAPIIYNTSQVLDDIDVLLITNNFSEQKQLEAPAQPLDRNTTDFLCFNSFIEKYKQKDVVIGFADVRYSNGGDIVFVEWVLGLNDSIGLGKYAYAGWNTNGNTLGTVISNSILLHLFRDFGDSNRRFTILRLLEDDFYQATFRQYLSIYAENVSPPDSPSNLSNDLLFYIHFSQKLLSAKIDNIKEIYKDANSYTLASVYYPWNRTFEIGLFLNN